MTKPVALQIFDLFAWSRYQCEAKIKSLPIYVLVKGVGGHSEGLYLLCGHTYKCVNYIHTLPEPRRRVFRFNILIIVVSTTEVVDNRKYSPVLTTPKWHNLRTLVQKDTKPITTGLKHI